MGVPDLNQVDHVLAMDFHLNWLAAALQLAFDHKSVGEDLDQTVLSLSVDGVEGAVPERSTFERNQEDIDLLLGWRDGEDYKLVLVEAKAHSAFSTKQIASKSARFAAIFGPEGERYAGRPVQIAIVLAGFREPQQSQFKTAWGELAIRETNVDDKHPRFVSLLTAPQVLMVGEHDDTGKPKTGGKLWRVSEKTFSAPA